MGKEKEKCKVPSESTSPDHPEDDPNANKTTTGEELVVKSNRKKHEGHKPSKPASARSRVGDNVSKVIFV